MPDFLGATKAIREDKSWRWRRSPPTCGIAAQKSPVRWIARWSSTRSIRARKCSWRISRTRIRRRGKMSSRARRTARCVRRTIAFTSPEGKEYKLKEKTATLMVRPRGWHLVEKHVTSTANRCPAACSISACISSQRRRIAWSAAAARIFICRSWKAISKRGCGTTFSISRRSSEDSARLDPRDGSDRNDSRHVRDRGDSVRIARTFRRG